jgi:DNA-binding beta-propeller fold protein YncE
MLLAAALTCGIGGAGVGVSAAWGDLSGGELSIVAGNGNSGSPIHGPATDSPLNLPWGVAVNRATGDLYIADALNEVVERVNAAGKLSVVAGNGHFRGLPTPGPAIHTDIWFPDGLAVDPRTGDLYIADSGHEMIEQVNPAGTLSIVAGTGIDGSPTPGPATQSDLNDPSGLAFNPRTGNLYISDSANNVVERVTAAGRLSIVAGTGTQGPPTAGPATQSDLWSPSGVTVDPRTGDLFIADAGNNMVERVTHAGKLSIVAGTGDEAPPSPGPATASALRAPSGVTVDPRTGDLYIADTYNYEVEQVTADGTLSIVAGTGINGSPTPGPATSSDLSGAVAVAIDPTTDDLDIADPSNDVIEQVGAGACHPSPRALSGACAGAAASPRRSRP